MRAVADHGPGLPDPGMRGHAAIEVERDGNGMEILSRTECMALLDCGHIGRVGVSLGALPVVLPVNYALLDGDIVIRTRPGTKLDGALAGAVVAFEVDHVDPLYHEGWSVLVQGRAAVIDDPETLAQAGRLPLRPWVGRGDHRYIAIRAELVSGRRISREEPGA